MRLRRIELKLRVEVEVGSANGSVGDCGGGELMTGMVMPRGLVVT